MDRQLRVLSDVVQMMRAQRAAILPPMLWTQCLARQLWIVWQCCSYCSGVAVCERAWNQWCANLCVIDFQWFGLIICVWVWVFELVCFICVFACWHTHSNLDQDTSSSMVHIQCSTLYGNVVTVPTHAGMTAQSFIYHCMLRDTWKCGTAIHMVSPLAINVTLADIAKSGGCIRVSTWGSSKKRQ